MQIKATFSTKDLNEIIKKHVEREGYEKIDNELEFKYGENGEGKVESVSFLLKRKVRSDKGSNKSNNKSNN